MSERQRITNRVAAAGDNEIRQWTEQITKDDNSQLMSEIKALEDKMADEEMGPLNDEPKADFPEDLKKDDKKEASSEWITAKEMETICASCAKNMVAKNISRVKASWVQAQIFADDMKEEPKAGDILKQNDRAEHNWPAEKPNEDMANKNDAIMSDDKKMDEPKADDKMDEKKASAKTADEGQPQGEIEEQIENDHNQVVEEFDPNMEADNILPHAEKKQMASTKTRQAAIYTEATKRLDRVASYLEKHGRKQLAFRIDKVSDALTAKLNSLK